MLDRIPLPRPIAIYMGPDHTPLALRRWVTGYRATESVIVNGSMEDKIACAMKAKPGLTVGCYLADFCEQSGAFHHPVLLVSAILRRLYVVDTLDKDGWPATCVVYAHRYGKFVDLNDFGALPKLVAANPSILKNGLRFDPVPPKPTGPHKTKSPRAPGKPFFPIGARRRAVNAGLVSESILAKL